MALNRRNLSGEGLFKVNAFTPDSEEQVFSFKLKAVNQELSTPVKKESNLKVNEDLNMD